MSPDLSWAFVSWFPHSRRSEMFAQVLGGQLYCTGYRQLQSPLYAPIKYTLQAIRTLWILFATRPRVVHVQNPPFVCGLTVYVYCLMTGARFVFDHHSGAFARPWKWALPIQRFLARRAVTNIVTNQHWMDIVHSWKAHSIILGDPFLPLAQGKAFAVEPGFNVAFVSAYAPDEPLEAVVAAAAQLPDIHLYITGKPKRRPQSFFDALPANVTCTGFLPDADYVGLLRAADAIMALTKRNHTLQLGGCEAVSLGQPLITSDWPFLQSFFPKGTVHVNNTAEGIRDGILTMQREHPMLKEEMAAFRDTARSKWDAQLDQLVTLVTQGVRP